MAGIYIHIPFCKQACSYCNFHFSTSLKLKNELLEALHRELFLQKEYLAGQKIETIYFGGGTPSLLSAEEINKLTETIYNTFNISNLKEFTLEANPDDLSTKYLTQLRNTQVNRLSIGVQSFFEHDLQYMNRAHNAQEADYAIKAAQDSGFTNLTIDLIYGTPGLSDKNWTTNLAKVKELQIPHFSSYALTVEEGTALHHQIEKKKTVPTDAEQAARQLEILMNKAQEYGYEHYEISNFAQPDQYAVHNTNYWLGQHYLGIGPSAHSFNGHSRSWNIANNPLYIKDVLANKTIPSEQEILSPTQQINEYIMTSLRTMWGCDLEKVKQTWGTDYTTELLKNAEPFIQAKKVLRQDAKLTLTNEGKLIADRIASELFF